MNDFTKEDVTLHDQEKNKTMVNRGYEGNLRDSFWQKWVELCFEDKLVVYFFFSPDGYRKMAQGQKRKA